MKVLAIVLVSLLAFPAHACRIRYIPAEERLASASSVHLGVVTGLHLVELERALVAAQDDVLVVNGVREGRVTVIRTLRGRSRSVVEALFPSCGPFLPEMQSKVVVLAHGNSYEVSSDPELVRLVERQLGGL